MTKQLSYSVLPLTNDPYQVFTTDVAPDGTPLHARIEIRYLAAAGRWVVSIFDHAAATLLANQVPLAVSAGFLLDLKKAGKTLIVSTHNDELAHTLADRLVVIGDDHTIESITEN